MGIYLGDKQGTLYRGSYKPVNLYSGDKKAAGWKLSEKTGTELSWDDTYNDKVLSAVVEGKSEQAVTVETITNALAPYIVPLRYGAGAVDMSVEGMTNARWLYNGTIYTASRLRLTVQDGDVIYLLVDAFGYTAKITGNFVTQPYAGDLSDLQGKITYYLNLRSCSLVTGSLADLQGKITYYLNLYNCSLVTGSLADLQGKITYYLNLRSCSLVTGSLADLQGKITYYLDLGNCSLVTGSLADLQGKITYYLDLYNCSLVTGSLADLQGKITYYLNLRNCSLVTGVYTPDGNGTPTYTYLDYTGLSAADMDATLIAYAATTKSNGTFQANGMTRTSASDAAVSTLQGRGWSVTGITKV